MPWASSVVVCSRASQSERKRPVESNSPLGKQAKTPAPSFAFRSALGLGVKWTCGKAARSEEGRQGGQARLL